ncbi:MAG: AAA family ATPase [Bacteroidales bacterium]|nr:AAA family ATPase [Bacteroidales bacterium]
MIEKHISKLILEKFEYTPTPSQKVLIEKLASYILNHTASIKQREIFIIKGFAGTGKTTIISSLINALKDYKIKSVLLAPTGRAAKVLTTYSGENAFTIHKKIYRQKSSKDGFGKFILDINLHTNTIFIVDEASMISNDSNGLSVFGSGRLLDDLLEYVFNNKNCRLIIVGDTAQLPPVGIDISQALKDEILINYNFDVIDIKLTDVVRHSLNSGILFNATRVRKLVGNNNSKFPSIKLSGFNDIKYLNGEDLLEEITDAYNNSGIENCIIVCRSNKRANKYNQGIRKSILWREDEISVGDYLMIVKNNYFWCEENSDMDFIANGDIVEIIKIGNYEERYDLRFANITVRFIDYDDIEIDVKIILDTLTIETASLTSEDNKKLFYSVIEDYSELKTKKKQYKAVKNDPYFNALQVKFSYAVTCHKAQGGQWDTVFIDQGYLVDDMINIEYLRWLYTAITRATNKLFLVNFNKDFFEDLEEY